MKHFLLATLAAVSLIAATVPSFAISTVADNAATTALHQTASYAGHGN